MPPPKVFLSYSHKDEVWKDRLATHLGVLEAQGLLQTWDDRRIGAGEEWLAEIHQHMEEVGIAVFLVSADSLTSRFILHEEIPRLLERRGREGVAIFPVVVRSCAWDRVNWLARMQVRPRDGKPLADFRGNGRDRELTRIVKEILDTVEQLRAAQATEKPESSGTILISPPATTSISSTGSHSEFKLAAIPPESLEEQLCRFGRLTVIRNRYVPPEEQRVGGVPGAPNRIYVGPADIGKTRAALEWIKEQVAHNPSQWVIFRPGIAAILPGSTDKIKLDQQFYDVPHRFLPQKAILFLDDLPLNLPPPDSPLSANDAVRNLFRWFQSLPFLRERRFVGTIRLEDIHGRPGWPDVLPSLGQELELIRVLPLDSNRYQLLWEGMAAGAVSRSQQEEDLQDFRLDLKDGFLAGVADQPADPEAVAVFVQQNALKEKSELDEEDAQKFSSSAVETWLRETWPALRDSYGTAARVFLSLARFLEASRRPTSGFFFSAGPAWEYHEAFGPEICRLYGDDTDVYLSTLEHLLTDGHAVGEAQRWIRPKLDFLLQADRLDGIDIELPDLTWIAQRASQLNPGVKRALAIQEAMSINAPSAAILEEDDDWSFGWGLGLGVLVEANHPSSQSKDELLDQAILIFEKLVGRLPEDSDSLLALLSLLGTKAKRVQDAQERESLHLRELSLYGEVVARFADSPEPALREKVAQALFNKGVRLGQLGRSDEAVAVYEEVVARFADSPETALREKVAQALFNKGVRLGQLGRSDEEVAVYEEVVARFADSPETALREQVAQALVNKGFRLGQLERSDEAVAVYEEVASRFGDSPEPALREIVATALYQLSMVLLTIQRWPEALEAAQRAVSFGAQRYNLACALSRTGNVDEALTELEGCLSRGEISREHVLEDPDWEALREDQRFKELTKEPGAHRLQPM